MIFGSLYVRSLGVHVSRDAVRAVELVRLGRRVRCRGSWTVPIEHGLSDAVRTLSRLTCPGTLRVITHLDAAHVRASVRDVPTSDAGQSDWGAHAASEMLPGDAVGTAFASARRVFKVDGNGCREGVAVAARAAIAARASQFEEGGLPAQFVGVMGFELPNAGAFDGTFGDRCRALVLQHESRFEVLELEDGVLRTCRPAGSTDLEELISEAETMECGSGEVWFAPSEAATAVRAHARVQLFHPLEGVSGLQGLDPTFAAAAGLAVRGLYVEPGSADDGSFLDVDTARALHALHQASLSRRLAFCFAGFALALLSIATTADLWSSKRLAEAELALAPLAATVAALQREEALIRRLSADVAAAEDLAGTRTQAAALLSAVADRTPDGVRWQDVVLRIDDEDQPLLVVKGLAQADASLSAFLRSLEQADFIAEVRLVLAETVVPRVTNDAISTSGVLRRFEVQAVIPGAALAPDHSIAKPRES